MNTSKKLLIVDDETDFTTLLKTHLEANAYLVTVANAGQEAIEKIKQEKPDLIILDLIMPKLNGYEVCKILKNDENFKSIPIIILSVLGQQHEIEKAKQAGADTFIQKPFEIKDLVHEIEKLLNR